MIGQSSDDVEFVLGGGRAPAIVANIWATVDLERALAEFGRSPAEAAEASVDELLGARVVVIGSGSAPAHDERPDQAMGPSQLVLAEPITEGRLAATLARHGEGIVGRYIGVADGLAAARARAAVAGLVVSRPGDGPFGPSILILGGPVTGPHLILVEMRAVPSPP